MPRNTLLDLNNHLFEQLERLNDPDLKGEQLKEELKRTKSMTDVAKRVIEVNALVLDAQKHIDEYGLAKNTLPSTLSLECKDET